MAARHIVVIGAGIVGAASAVELLRDGHRVTVLEPGPPGGEQAASYGNGCFLSPGSVVPIACPGCGSGCLASRRSARAARHPLVLSAAAAALAGALRAGRNHGCEGGADGSGPGAAARRRAGATCAARGGSRRRRADRAARHPVSVSRPRRVRREALAWRLRRGQRRHLARTRRRRAAAAGARARPPLHLRVLVEQGGNVTDPGGYVAALVAHAEAQGALRSRAGDRLPHRGRAAAGGRDRAPARSPATRR